MKYVVLSFDDGRKDFYTNALPVLKKYRLPATLNIITDTLVEASPCEHAAFPAYMTKAEIMECADSGVEIACHSANHTNDLGQIRKGMEFLKAVLKTSGGKPAGFASPHSDICRKNFDQYSGLLKDGTVLYIRSGRQLKRDGYLYAALYVLYRMTKSKTLFRWYNRRNLICMDAGMQTAKRNGAPGLCFYPSVSCNADNSIGQIAALLRSMPENHAAIIMFHSILSPGEPGWGADKWQNSTEQFDELCRYLSQCADYKVVTTAQLHELAPCTGALMNAAERVKEQNT